MKRLFFPVFSIVVGLSFLFSCQPEDKDNPSGGGDKTVHVTGITLSQSSLPLKEGETATLIATVRPDDATNKRVSWSSNNNEVATVEDGVVTAILAGQAIITATTEDGGKTATCSVTVSQNLAPSVTVDADKISAISVVLKGKANLGSTVAADLRVGFQYSKSAGILPSNSTTVDAEDSDADYNYTTGITGLEPSTTYYFRSFVRQNGVDTYGETKQFQTKDIASLIHTQEASAVSAISGRMNASYDLTDVLCTDKSFGFYWGTSEESMGNKVTASEEDGAISADLSMLNPSKRYYFQAFALLDGKELKEVVKSFTTKDMASILETLDASGIDATSATLNAKLDLTDVKYGSIEYGFYWGASESSQPTKLSGGSIAENTYSVSLTYLSHKTQYWYNSYVILDSQTFYGEVKTFTTDVVPVESVSLNNTEHTFNTIGNTLALKATVLPSDATDKSIEWTSDKEDVATVTSSGVVTAKGNGKATITVTTKDQGKSATCVITVAQWVTGISLDKTSITLVIGAEATLSVASVLPDNANDKTYTWSSSDSAIASVDNSGKVTARASGTATIRATANDGSGVNATCSVVVSPKCPTGAVDMGTTTVEGYKLYWATTNIGASKPEDYGDYYAWGETEPHYSSQDPLTWEDGKTGYNWASYKWCNGSSSTLTKYNTKSSYGTVDNKTVLDQEDDVASVKLGGKWRMPTHAEWTELQTKCTWTWTDNYNGTGVAGRIVSATNGNSIFLPAAGCRHSTFLTDAGTYGSYWSSSLCTGGPSGAWYVIFTSGGSVGNSGNYRYDGRSVRPVSE